MTTTEILTGIKNWVVGKLNLKQNVISDLADIRSGAQAGATSIQPADILSYFDNAVYDSGTHRINFYHGQSVIAYIDASPFIIDGMVNDVRIENGYLVIDFNTDSGKQDISIPLTDIFNPSNYYNKTQTDGMLAQKQDVIQDLAAIRSGASAGATAVQPSTLNSALSDTVAESGVYDVTANNNNAKFASLSALLGSENLDTLIPSAKRKGGMSIKFVQSSDNKYVQYRLMADSWSIDTNDWSFCGNDVLVDNPEFVYVKTDSEDRILWAIRTDGDIFYGAGVPSQVVNYINKKIAELSLDEYEDIVAFLNDLEKGDKTLQTLLDEKVDKEEGKSLVDAEYANGVRYIENPEFTEVKLGADDKILEATMLDGTKLLPAGVKVIGTAEYDGATVKTVENPEFAGVWLDTDEKILFGVQTDGNFLFGCGVPRQVKDYIEQKIEELSLDEYESIVTFIGDYLNNTTLEELLSKKVDGEYVENLEFIEAKVDAKDKILEATEKDGTKLFGGDVKVLGSIDINGVTYKVVSNPEWLEVVLDEQDRIICGIKADGKFVVYVADFLDDIENIKARLKELDAYSVTENPEFLDITLDADNKVLEGTKTDGTKVVGSNLEVGENLKVKGNVEIGGNVSYKNGIPQEIIDYIDANTGSGVSSIEYDDATGDMYATFNDDDGVTDVYMDENGDIYVDIEE